jgi:tripeptide aminopeptidase
MLSELQGKPHITELARRAIEKVCGHCDVKPIRGGTDGAVLSFRGLPCPNIFAGGINFHGPYEFVPIQSMEKATRLIVKICQLTADYNS